MTLLLSININEGTSAGAEVFPLLSAHDVSQTLLYGDRPSSRSQDGLRWNTDQFRTLTRTPVAAATFPVTKRSWSGL
jgi:hypothetical protein